MLHDELKDRGFTSADRFPRARSRVVGCGPLPEKVHEPDPGGDKSGGKTDGRRDDADLYGVATNGVDSIARTVPPKDDADAIEVRGDRQQPGSDLHRVQRRPGRHARRERDAGGEHRDEEGHLEPDIEEEVRPRGASQRRVVPRAKLDDSFDHDERSPRPERKNVGARERRHAFCVHRTSPGRQPEPGRLAVGMRIDRQRFFAIAAALASSACPGPSPKPIAPPAKAAQPPAGRCPKVAERVTTACPGVDPVDDPRARCERYEQTYAPEAARRATDCLLAMPPEIVCDDRCVAYDCGRSALRGFPVDTDASARCNRVEAGCAGMRVLCEQFLPGMNQSGRDKLTACLLESCGLGIDYCLGHTGYVAACVEES